MGTVSHIRTAEELLASGELGRCELVRGELEMMSPAGEEHGWMAHEIGRLIGNFVAERGLGRVYAAETGFLLSRNPDTVRAADVAFVAKDRISQRPSSGFFEGAPDLAVEVLSPNDPASSVLAKVEDWLRNGARQVWLVDPRKRTISVYRIDVPVATYHSDEVLRADELFPGFELSLEALLK